MTGTNRPIFRRVALQRYAQAREQAVLPRSVAPPTFAILWAVVALLLAAAAAVWCMPVSATLAGILVVLEAHETPGHVTDTCLAVLLLAEEDSAHVRVGQTLGLQIGPNREPFRLHVTAAGGVESDDPTLARAHARLVAASPRAARRLIAARGQLAAPVEHPAGCGLERGDYEAEASLEPRPVGALIPRVGSLPGGVR